MPGEKTIRVYETFDADPSLRDEKASIVAQRCCVSATLVRDCRRTWTPDWRERKPRRRPQRVELGKKTRRVYETFDADPSLLNEASHTIAQRAGVSQRTACEAKKTYRPEWKEEAQVEPSSLRCRRCTFPAEPRNPIVDGLCLLCRLDAQKIPPLTFFERGGALALGLGGAGGQ